MRGKAKATLALESAILEIVAERAPITVRGVCYALFTRQLIDSMQVKNTGRVSKIMTAMREDGALDWTSIVDGSRAVERPGTWSDPSSIVEAAVQQYRRDQWQGQPTFVEVWSEKSTVHGILAPVLKDLGVTFRVMKGFGSFTAIKQAAKDGADNLAGDQPTVVLYLGDWDCSGLYMSQVDLPARLARYGGPQEIRRIALLERDIADLPHFDADSKARDARYRWYVERYGRRCWEIDALSPNDLRNRVREEIESYIDHTLWQRGQSIEAAEIESMKDFHKAWQGRLGSQP